MNSLVASLAITRWTCSRVASIVWRVCSYLLTPIGSVTMTVKGSREAADPFHSSNSSSDKIYVLKATHRSRSTRWYIGRTENVGARLERHLQGRACNYTKRLIDRGYALTLDAVIKTSFDFAEDAVTKMYMRRFGVHSVAGGSYAFEISSPSHVFAFLGKEIDSSVSICYECKMAFPHGCICADRGREVVMR